MRRDFSIIYQYTYPPITLASLIFYFLNPDVLSKIEEVVGRNEAFYKLMKKLPKKNYTIHTIPEKIEWRLLDTHRVSDISIRTYKVRNQFRGKLSASTNLTEKDHVVITYTTTKKTLEEISRALTDILQKHLYENQLQMLYRVSNAVAKTTQLAQKLFTIRKLLIG